MILFLGFVFLIFVKFPFLFFWLLLVYFNCSSEPFTQPSSATLKLNQVVENLILLMFLC